MKSHRYFFVMIIILIGVVVLMITIRRSNRQFPEKIWEKPDFVLVVHGGAGDMTRESLPDSMEAVYREELRTALIVGYRILDSGGSALDAVEAVVRYLEDCPLFNAGKGAVYTMDGKNELDASIMGGATGMAGAVAGVTTVKHPVSLARRVMENSDHVFLAGRGAEEFAQHNNIEMVDPAWFHTEKRYESWRKAMEEMNKQGTVGAVALDRDGHLAAATSTGGMAMKRFGRIGDSPVIGAGTYASNQTCAISCTGHGEYFIRNVVAYDCAARMAYGDESLREAANDIILNKIRKLGGTGGLIGVDKSGHYTMVFNTPGMFRGYILSGGESNVMIYDDEQEK